MPFTLNLDFIHPERTGHLDFIAQFTTNIRHIKGTANMAADAMSRRHIDGVQTVDAINLQQIAGRPGRRW